MIEQEAQMMAFLLEAEYGAEITLKNTKENLRFKEPLLFDNLLDNALNQVIFKKCVKEARLQAVTHARKWSENQLKQAYEKD